MTATYTVEVQCDLCYEHEHVACSGSVQKLASIFRKGRLASHKRGWITRIKNNRMEDYCPDCKQRALDIAKEEV